MTVADQGTLPLDSGPPPYKILTFHQPWASAIIPPGARGPGDWRAEHPGTPWPWALKDIENRGWPTRWRHRVFIHAGKALDLPGEMITDEIKRRARQAGINLYPCDVPDYAWPAGWDGDPLSVPFATVLGYVRYAACTSKWNPSPWAERDSYHHWMRDAVALTPPITGIAGKQSMWVPGPDDELAKLLAAIP